MKRGPKAQPPKLKVTPGRPMPPTDLQDPVALKAWDSICEDLIKEDRLVETDAKLIEVYARTYAIFFRIDEQMREEPLKQINATREFINPLLTSHAAYSAKLVEILAKLKLTPYNRGKHARKAKNDTTDKWKSVAGGLN